MNKYDWSNVPKEVRWIATDEDGWAWGWINEPRYAGTIEWLSLAGYGNLYCEFYIKPEDNPFKGNWQDSLEERPNDL